jgi:hypothetical protein
MINSPDRYGFDPKPNCERCQAGSAQEKSILKDIEDLKALHPTLVEYMGLTNHSRDSFRKPEEIAEGDARAQALLKEDEGLEVAKKAYERLAALLPRLEAFTDKPRN